MSQSFEPKIVVVGDGMVGKTSLLMTYRGKKINQDYLPTIIGNYTVRVSYGGQRLKFSMWDTAGQEEYDRIRTLSYYRVGCFMVCFSLDDSVSLANVKERWVPELHYYAQNVPFILVGNKLDLRDRDSSQGVRRLVSFEEGNAMKEEIGAMAYVECSAYTGEGVKEAFGTAIRVAMGESPTRRPAAGARCFKNYAPLPL